MISWQCSLCWEKQRTEIRPILLERLCAPCKVKHWERVLMIEAGDQRSEHYRNAKKRLAEARAALAEAL